jgi:hypothetical protein
MALPMPACSVVYHIFTTMRLEYTVIAVALDHTVAKMTLGTIVAFGIMLLFSFP